MTQTFFNDELETKLKIINGEEIEYCLEKTNVFYYKAKRNLRKINAYYHNMQPYDKVTKSDRLFCDSYHKLSQQLENSIHQMKQIWLPIGKLGELPRFYRILEQVILDKSFPIHTNSIIAIVMFYQKAHELLEAEFYLIKDFLMVILSDYAVAYCEHGYDEQDNFEHSLKVLYEIQSIDIDEILKAQSKVEAILSCDYENIYQRQTQETKSYYRYMVSVIAKENKEKETNIANSLVDKSKEKKQHVGFLLYKEYKKYIKNNRLQKSYFGFLYGLPLFLSGLFYLLTQNWWIWILLYFPMIELIKPLVMSRIQRKLNYIPAPEIDLKENVSQENKTLVVISTILPETDELSQFKKRIEKTMQSNQSGAISYLILADFKQALTIETPKDQVQLNQIDMIIKEINKKHKNNLLLLVRPREYSRTQKAYIGKERKRGAIEELVAAICDNSASYLHHCGDMNLLNNTQYIMALDYDTDLLMNSVLQLLQIAVHPCNQPVIDKKTNMVKSGYGIIVPDIRTELKASLKTPFSRLMGGIGGTSSYNRESNEFYQNLYHSSIFTGKGLIHVKTYYQVLQGRFASETVLSHDILEGAFLRACHTSKVELLDGFPVNEKNYMKRLHRWIRGDAQNIPFLFKNVEGETFYYENPILRISKYQLWDNVRRSVTPFLAVSAIILSAFLSAKVAFICVLLVLLSCMMPYLLHIVHSIFTKKLFFITARNFSGLPNLLKRLLYRGILEFILLPQSAYIGINAFVKGIYRRYISHAKMLEWVTAAQTQQEGSKGIYTLLFYLPSILVSIFLFVTPYWTLRIVGGFFLLNVLFGILSAKETIPQKPVILEEERRTLQADLEKMFQYYQTYCTEKTNFLPPDNVQRLPVSSVAYRTSPTNIGMMLVSYLSARDFNLISDEDFYLMLDRVINTLEKLQTYRGNLYNWYDIETLKALPSYFVSAVDSGNFLCCLVCLKEGVKEYQKVNPIFQPIIHKIENLIAKTDLACFYDEKKALFSIGYDSQTGRLSNSYYDMLMSEARMTSYFAIAKGIVPKKHWGSLSRISSQKDRYCGSLSWTGTMFEYFMPELFLHCIKGSLGYEALHYCVMCQKKRTTQRDMPYGVSESGIYAFDENFNYQYNPNGVQQIALKQGQNMNLVIAPYASYLTLSMDFESAYNNIIYLKQLGVDGRFGLYEALDYTKSRIGENKFIPVYSYMAHHLGMSIVAITNALQDNIMQKRFLRDSDMQRATELLQENLDNIASYVRPQKGLHKISYEEREEKVKNVGKMHPLLPKVNLLGNSELTGIYTDVGVSFLKTDKFDITRRSVDLLKNPSGMFCYFNDGDETTSLTFAPQYRSDCEYETGFSAGEVIYSLRQKNWKSKLSFSFHRTFPCQQQMVQITNSSSQPIIGSFIVCIEPVLYPYLDDLAHQTFSKLFLSIDYIEKEKILIAQRRQRENENAMFLAVGFLEDVEYLWEANREKLFSRSNPNAVNINSFTIEEGFNKGIPDAMIAIKKEVVLEAGETKAFHILSVAAEEKSRAIEIIQSVRSQSPINSYNNAKTRFSKDSLEEQIAQIIVPQVVYHKKDSSLQRDMRMKNKLGKTVLWKLGISGDVPLVLVEISNEKDTQRIETYLKCFSLLQLYEVYYDLAFLYDEPTEEKTVENILQEYVQKYFGNSLNKTGRVFLLEKSQMEEEEIVLLKAFACHAANRSMVKIEKPLPDYLPKPIEKVERDIPKTLNGLEVYGGFFFENSFFITEKPNLPWCHVLANPTFGTLLTDSSVGFSWAINSRENKLTPWSNDTIRDLEGEQILMKYHDEIINCVKGACTEYNPHYAKYHGKFHELILTVTVTVPSKGMIKYIDLEIQNIGYSQKKIDFAYYTEPTLGVNRENCAMIKSEYSENMLIFQNPFQMSGNAYMGITSSEDISSFTCSRSAFLNGIWDSEDLEPTQDLCGAIVVKKIISPQKNVSLRFMLCYSATKIGLKKIIEFLPSEKYFPQNKIQINTSDESIDKLVNTWLPHQMIASRIYGRTGFYQCSGAYGFRDQLQDCINYLPLSPKLLRTHILRCCAVQFEAGDVMHWWHSMPQSSGGRKGVRTRYSDDLIWLVYAVNEYVKKTNDIELLDIKTAYLVAPEIPENQKDLYLEVQYTASKGTVYDHCNRALKRAYRLGRHGLPLMGSGDWNDGYSKVGIKGEGESVWLAQFLSMVMVEFADLCDIKQELKLAEEYRQKAEKLLENVDRYCYDKDHYIRAFYDNGEIMGAYENEECKIDSLTQSFSVFSKMKNEDRKKLAMETAYHMLVDEKYGIIKLFTPPFHDGDQEPGYVKAYPKGIRENGGQYTHAAVWFAMAMSEIGKTEEFLKMMDYLNPIKKCADSQLQERYQIEPYYMAADIYTNQACYGRGGWSIYTGTAGWYYRLLLENWAGISFEPNQIILEPRYLPLKKEMELVIKNEKQKEKITAVSGKKTTLLFDWNH